MLRIVKWFNRNISLLNFSGSLLILASIHSLKIINKNSIDNCGIFKYRMAAVGFCMIIGDTVNAMIYKSRYPVETLFPLSKELIPKNVSLIFPALETICSDGIPCLTCSLYVHYDIALCGRFQLVLLKIAKEVDWFYKNVFRPKCPFWKTPFIELFLGVNMVSFGLHHENQYVIMAAAPYQIATVFFNPGHYYSRKTNRIIYNFLMLPYVVFIANALCEPVKIS